MLLIVYHLMSGLSQLRGKGGGSVSLNLSLSLSLAATFLHAPAHPFPA